MYCKDHGVCTICFSILKCTISLYKVYSSGTSNLFMRIVYAFVSICKYLMYLHAPSIVLYVLYSSVGVVHSIFIKYSLYYFVDSMYGFVIYSMTLYTVHGLISTVYRFVMYCVWFYIHTVWLFIYIL